MDGSIRGWASPSRSSRSRSSWSPELPRWASPGPMMASIIPPPIVQSIYPASPRTISQSISIKQPTSTLDRQNDIEADLQFLLDAQVDGLVRGYSMTHYDDISSTGSTTPTIPSLRNLSPRRNTRLRERKKLSLRSARKGIYTRMLALSAAKSEELQELDEDVHIAEKTLHKIDHWEKKRDAIRDVSGSIGAGKEQAQMEKLQKDSLKLRREIEQARQHLKDLEVKHSNIEQEMSNLKNVTEAKQATYANALRMEDEKIQRFLATKPKHVACRQTGQEIESSMWDLPLQRRTLDMAREYWAEDREATLQSQQNIGDEIAALDEGAPIWKDVMEKVSEFETRLRTELTKSTTQAPASDTAAWEDPPSDIAAESDGPKDHLDHINTLIEDLESRLEYVKEKRWNLLIAAISAELEALEKGRHMLQDLLGISHDPGDRGSVTDGGEEIRALDQSFETARRSGNVDTVASAEDDPEPDLLFSKHESDVE